MARWQQAVRQSVSGSLAAPAGAAGPDRGRAPNRESHAPWQRARDLFPLRSFSGYRQTVPEDQSAPGAQSHDATQPSAADASRWPLGHAVDEGIFRRVAGLHSPALDRLMPRLSVVASYSALWIGTAGAIALLGGPRGRLVAATGLGAVAATSAVANLAMKGVARRVRPRVEVPAARRLEQPTSSSFPSGHTASAAAFSGVVGREIPPLWLPLNTTAAAVGFSRVYTGVHYPGDVAIGWLLGKTMAAGARRVLHRFEEARAMPSPISASTSERTSLERTRTTMSTASARSGRARMAAPLRDG
jgi:membrane-associated phospholipid phosphatase